MNEQNLLAYSESSSSPGMHNPRSTSQIRPPKSCIRPSEQAEKYQKFLLNDGDFMNEFKLHWIANNFAT